MANVYAVLGDRITGDHVMRYVLNVASVWSLLLLVSSPGVSAVEAAPVASTLPSVAQTVFDQLLARRLELSTAKSSASERLWFLLEFYRPQVDKRDPEKLFDVAVVRHRERVAALFRNAEGLPYCLLATGFAVALDPDVPGQLLVRRAAQPQIVLQGGADGLHLLLGTSTIKQPRLLIDVTSVLTAPQNPKLAYDARTHTLTVRGSETIQWFGLSDSQGGDQYPLSFWMIGGGQTTIRLRDVRISTDPPLDLLSVTLDKVQSLRLPKKDVTGDRTRSEAAGPPPGLAKSDRMQGAARTVATLIGPPQAATTGPATRP